MGFNEFNGQENYTNNNKKIWWIVLVVLLLIIVIGGLFLYLNKNKNEKVVEEPQNNQSNGVIDNGDMADEKDKTQTPLLPGKISLTTDDLVLTAGEEFKVWVLLDSMGSNVVVASAELNYDSNLLELIQIDTDESVLEIPILKNEKDGRLEIVRGSPGDTNYKDSDDGFTGKGGLMVELNFRAVNEGMVNLSFNEAKSRMVLDDGMGTALKMDYENLNLQINK